MAELVENNEKFDAFGGGRDLPRLTPENECQARAWDSHFFFPRG